MYGYKKQINKNFEDTVESVKTQLIKEGFGILCEIDVQATLKKRLGVEYDKYVILGACNPSFAHKALQTEKEIGLLLPCNIIVYELKGKTFVSSILPTVAMEMIDSTKLNNIAKKIECKLVRVVEGV